MDAYEELLERLKDIDLVNQIGGLLGWDQEVLMPPKAAKLRAEQLSWVSKTGHEKLTHPRIGELLNILEREENLSEIQKGNIRLTRDSYNKATKLPTEFVAEMAKHKSKSQISWTEARAKNDFSLFRDDLAKMVEMSRKKADYLGFQEVRYDALLDLYESGLTVSKVDPLFAELRNNVAPLVKKVVENGKMPEMSWVHGNKWDKAGQEKLSQSISGIHNFPDK